MARRIYSIIGIIALAPMIYLIVNPGQLSSSMLVWLVTLLYAIVVGCAHGILAHSLSAKQKGSLIFYPIFMGTLFGGLAYIYIYVVLPLIIPGFFQGHG